MKVERGRERETKCLPVKIGPKKTYAASSSSTAVVGDRGWEKEGSEWLCISVSPHVGGEALNVPEMFDQIISKLL